jgi:hypothetical protein
MPRQLATMRFVRRDFPQLGRNFRDRSSLGARRGVKINRHRPKASPCGKVIRRRRRVLQTLFQS